ncbi:DCD and Cell domain protein [Perilla frutescens var. hirtella]|nr:DCD and Cell domain protein [Perilla frutescens var. frutescens]KAH6783449.1 DCD and Cell domain protein [Perilla frutescens var. hirtella]
MENNQSSFWQFSDNLRLQTGNLADLSLNDSIWSTNYAAKRTAAEERRNFDFRSAGNAAFGGDLKSDFNLGFSNDAWKAPINDSYSGGGNYSGFGSGTTGLNGGFNKGVYSTPSLNFNSYSKGKGFANNVVVNGRVNKGKNEEEFGGKTGKKNRGNKESNKDSNGENKTAVDKRFKTLPPAEALPRNETIGGYIFVCNNDTMAENLKRQLFGLPPRYRDSVRAITPGLPLFLYNYSTHQLHGVFEASSFGGTNIDPTAWEDKKNAGESRFPAQVRVVTRKICEPLEEDSFRPILHHYDGPKFRLELNIPEALSLLDIFAESNP